MLSNMISHPKGELYYTTPYIVRGERGVVACYGKQEKGLFSYLWGLSVVDMEDYTGTKIALLFCVVYALLVLHYYRLVPLSW